MRSDKPRFLETAAALARRITESAIWFEGRCNWMGAQSDRSRPSGALATQSALGPDLYGGTSGVGLFLAEAGAILDDHRLRATAVGAIRHALDHAARVNPEARDGLYTGPIGIAYAAARVANVLEAESLRADARDVLLRWRRDGYRPAASEVMSGCAGAVTGLVALSELVQEPWIVDTAVKLGEELTTRAEATPAGWSWPAPRRRSTMYNLCGYSHGAAGIGHAFLELFGVTGDNRFRHASERAFDYERSWRDPKTGNWPDLREVARAAGRDAPVPTANTWCNGVAGIALTRWRATALLGSAAVRRDADLAVAACKQHVTELLVSAPNDFSLCHGAAGAADTLLYVADGPGDVAGLAAQVGRHGIEWHHRGGVTDFPCGVPVGETPGLLRGLAGIGMFYLRLSEPEVPSPLLVRRRQG